MRDADFEATEHAETINDYLSWLNRVDFKDWVPPALVYFKRFRQQPKLLAEFFQSLERLTYFLLVTKVGINERIETYAALTKEIEPETFKGDLAALTTLRRSTTSPSSRSPRSRPAARASACARTSSPTSMASRRTSRRSSPSSSSATRFRRWWMRMFLAT
nr:hypothetical protein [Ralstonia mannitolilytica]